MKIYVASSWRNNFQQMVVRNLRALKYEVYDFKDSDGFHWSSIDENWKTWNISEYRKALFHPLAEKGFRRDREAMKWADVCVLVLSCGRSAHLEAGWFAGQNKPVYVLCPEAKTEPELMYKCFNGISQHFEEILNWLEEQNE